MPTLYGPWVGGSTKGRIVCSYSVTYTADHTQAIFTGTLYVEIDQYTSDSVNSWGVSGDDGSHTGSNLAISFGSGGGMKAFYSNFSFQKYGDGIIAGSVYNVEAVGQTITATFTLDAGNLAPYLTSGYTPISITNSSFSVTGVHASGNGGTLNGMQMEVNYSPSDVGAWYFTQNTFANPVASDLLPYTLYYYRLCVRNSTYGYSAWGPWQSVRTLSIQPSQFGNTWVLAGITTREMTLSGLVAPPDNGAAIDATTVVYNTTQSDVGALQITVAGVPSSITLTDLNPGTTYFVKVAAHNANGWGAFSSWHQADTQPGVEVNVGGTYKVAVPYVNINGIWKPATRWVCISPGVWKQ